MTIPKFQQTILSWYKTNRRDLPWRRTHNPYRIMVSEVMLQQTQVSRVLPKYQEFLQAFPNPQALAASNDAKLLKIWSGLGYWRRARFLKEACKKIEIDFNGKFPESTQRLRTLPGIGPYTAGAISCFAFGNNEPFIDTNIRRVYLHFFFKGKTDVHDAEILKIAKKAIPKEDARNWNWALFDYGALALKDKKINKKSRHYAKQSKFIGSFRQYRAKLMRFMLSQPKHDMPKTAALDFLEEILRKEEQDYSAGEILESLIQDKLVKQNNTRIFL